MVLNNEQDNQATTPSFCHQKRGHHLAGRTASWASAEGGQNHTSHVIAGHLRIGYYQKRWAVSLSQTPQHFTVLWPRSIFGTGHGFVFDRANNVGFGQWGGRMDRSTKTARSYGHDRWRQHDSHRFKIFRVIAKSDQKIFQTFFQHIVSFTS